MKRDEANEVLRRVVAWDDIFTERERQLELWGFQMVTPAVWLAILTEEVGEVAKEIAEAEILGKEMSGYRTELIQVAAVALAAIESWEAQNG
jgi:NTP pyrophosphatase (non-canonical NTP hydrolase)